MRRCFALALLLVAACGTSPSSPSEPPASPPVTPVTFADFTGLWTVPYRVTSCQSHNCYNGLLGSQGMFELRLQQSGAEVRGIFIERSSVVDVSGRVSSDGTLVMSGSKEPAGPRDGGFRITALTLTRGGTTGLQGTVSYEDIPPSYGEGTPFGNRLTGDIASATRSDLSLVAASADGGYQGRFVVRSCTPIVRYCYPHDVNDVADITVTIAQSGGTLTAGFHDGPAIAVALEGTFSGRTVEMAGEAVTGNTGSQALVRVTNWRSALDAFGRMSGTFHLDATYQTPLSSLGGGVDCELLHLVKVVR